MLLLDSHRHSRDVERDLERDLGREVHKAEWRVKEQKLQEDIKTLRDKLLLLVKRGGGSMINHLTLRTYILRMR